MTSTHDPAEFQMGLLEHLRELRKRLFYCTIAISVGGVISYCYSAEVFFALCDPYSKAFHNSPLIGTGPAEAWVLKIKVALFCGAMITSPILFYQVWRFVAPGLYASERKLVLPFVVLSTALFSGGAMFCYYQILPLTLSFFYGEFKSIGITPTVKVGDHLSLMITTMLGFGAVFELPLLTFFLARAGILDHQSMVRWFRHAVVAIFIISAALTPPDVLTQLLMAGPLLLLYGISIGVAYLACGRVPETPAVSERANQSALKSGL
jgi:sec-independent protein translocase protein TatC